jgi:hypothetical protein
MPSRLFRSGNLTADERKTAAGATGGSLADEGIGVKIRALSRAPLLTTRRSAATPWCSGYTAGAVGVRGSGSDVKKPL